MGGVCVCGGHTYDCTEAKSKGWDGEVIKDTKILIDHTEISKDAKP